MLSSDEHEKSFITAGPGHARYIHRDYILSNSVLILCPLDNFFMLFCRLLIFFLQNFFQEYHLGVKQFGAKSGPTFCPA